MQASKPELKSPEAKQSKAQVSSEPGSPIASKLSPESAAKSVAQRVMDMTVDANGVANQSTDTNSSSTSMTTATVVESKVPSPLNASEIVGLSQRTSELKLSARGDDADQETADVHDSNNNLGLSGQLTNIKDATSSSSPSLLLDADSLSPVDGSSVPSSNPTGQPNSFNSLSMALGSSLMSSESLFRPTIVSAQQAKANCDSMRISLETRVPLQSKSGEFQTKLGDVLPIQQEEVSYYNDQATAGLLSYENERASKNKFLRQSNNKSNEHKSLTTVSDSSRCCRGANKFPQIPSSGHRSINLQIEQQQQQQQSCCEYMNHQHIGVSAPPQIEDDYATRYDNPLVIDEETERAEAKDNIDDNSTQDAGARSHYDAILSGTKNSPNEGPKAKSAPATPCNVTPIAFHQNTSHMNSTLHPSPANTLPPDIRKNISATCRVLPSSTSTHDGRQRKVIGSRYLDELFERGQSYLDAKDYKNAVRSFTQCIELASGHNNPEYLERNFKVYSQRAEAHFRMEHYHDAIEDSMAARGLNPKWTEAYLLQGQAQLQIGQEAAALAIFAFGLTQDPSNEKLFRALVEAARKSMFKEDFEAKYEKLRSLHLADKPFVVVSVLGQELLNQEHLKHATVILESALKLPDNSNKKFRGSVLASVAYAYCKMREYEKALKYMQKELELEAELDDVNGQCRVLSNLGYTYYKMERFELSLEAHRKQLTLAMRAKLYKQASQALNATGHVHVVKKDFSSALTSHTRRLELLRQLGEDDYLQARELFAIAHVNYMLRDLKAADESYAEAYKLMRNTGDRRKVKQ